MVAALFALTVSALGITVRAADVGTAAVDEPQYLLSALSLWEDHNLDISDGRAQGRADAFYDGALPVQTSVLEGGARISPHDPLLPLLLAPAVGLGGWIGAKIMLSVMAGLLAGATVWVLGTRWRISPLLAGSVATLAGVSAPLAVYGHQVYPELPAALMVVLAVGAILPVTSDHSTRRSPWAAVVLVLAISALPWLAIKYVLVAATLAVLALLRLRVNQPRTMYAVAASLAVSGLIFVAAHRAIYGGWTAYASGDHFQGSGEFGAVGFTPDYLGRSTRLIGLFVDRDYGLAAWQPGWLLVIPALGLLWGAQRRTKTPPAGPSIRRNFSTASMTGLAVLTLPLLAGYVTAVFVALTMHGFWWPGRQLVVVLPLAAMLVAIALSKPDAPFRRATLGVAVTLGAIGVAIHAWTLVAGHTGSLTWVGATNLTPPAPIAAMRAVLPDYRELGSGDWTLHALWIVAALLLLLASWMLGRRANTTPHHTSKGKTP